MSDPHRPAPGPGSPDHGSADAENPWLQEDPWVQDELAPGEELPEQVPGIIRILRFEADVDHSIETAPDDPPPAPVAKKPLALRRPPAPAPVFRPELQGLRAIAILMVVCYHIWFDRVSGGVDIFLLISAFLLTGSFARRLETQAPLAVPRYWLRAFTRLLPPAALVILATLAGAAALLPASRWRELIDEAIASGLYGENWLLAARSVDYYAADHSTASPFQHFWSLSVQGQVFVLWPLLFLLAALIIRLTGARPRTVLLVLFSAVGAASFAWSVHLTATDQALAYFDTRTRLWEFALGSLLALVLPLIERRLRRGTDRTSARHPQVRAAVSWIGLGLVLAAGWVIDVEGAFPGYAALWPLLAAALVIGAGATGTRWGADRLLSSRPMQQLGDLSYALYLVHWPLLVLVLVATGTTRAGPLLGAALVAASLVLAWLVTAVLDRPLRTSRRLRTRWWPGASIIAASLALILVAGTAWRAQLDAQTQEVQEVAVAADWADHPGARVLAADYAPDPLADPDAAPIPLLQDLPADMTRPDVPCRADIAVPDSGDIAAFCREITPEAPADAPLVVVAGNSHAMQALPMLGAAAQDLGWRIVTVARPQCSFGEKSGVAWCADYNEQVADFAIANGADAFVTVGTRSATPGAGEEQVVEGFTALAPRLLAAGIPILSLRDNPRFAVDMADCAAQAEQDPSATAHACDTPVRPSLAASDPMIPVAAQLDAGAGGARITPLDLTASICPAGTCTPVVGNVRVFVDADHISSTYSATMAPAFVAAVGASGFAPASPGSA